MTKAKIKGRSKSVIEVKHDRSGLKNQRIRCKKGGAGGNFTWGRPGDEVFIPALREGDPNYDSNDEDFDGFNLGFNANVNYSNKYDFSYLNHSGEALNTPKLNLSAFKVEAVKAIREFFVEGDMKEFLLRIQALDCRLLHNELVKKLVTLSMEKSDTERELVSKILIELQNWKLLSVNQVAKAFERMFESVDDLELDIPNVRKLLAQFLARSVADEVLPPVFLTNTYIESIADDIVDHAKTLLSIKHGLVRLERVWGVNTMASVDDLKQEIKLILLEYMSSSDANEAATLLKKLQVPFFHHEVIKRGVLLALEKKEREQAMISILFKQLVKSEVISHQQLILGFQRLFQELEDIKLDNPNAEPILGIFANQAVNDGCLTKEELSSLRKRAQEIAERERKLVEEQLSAEIPKPRSEST